MFFLSFLAIIMRGQRTVREQSENGQRPFSQPGPLGSAISPVRKIKIIHLNSKMES